MMMSMSLFFSPSVSVEEGGLFASLEKRNRDLPFRGGRTQGRMRLGKLGESLPLGPVGKRCGGWMARTLVSNEWWTGFPIRCEGFY